MSEKNICQNPKCCDNDTKDRWNKKIDKYQSRKAYWKRMDHLVNIIVPLFLNIFAQQVVRTKNGLMIILKVSLTIEER